VLQFLLLAIAIIAYGSLYPFHFEWTARADTPLATLLHGWPTIWDRWAFRDILLNIALYVPLGGAASLVLRARRSRALAAAGAITLAFALSTAMELTQMFLPPREPSVLDILSDTVGSALGAALAIAFERAIRRLTAAPLSGLRPAGAVLALVWAVQEFYPLVPAISRAHIFDSLFALRHIRNLPIVETWLGACEWLLLGLALDAVFARMRTLWLAGLMICALAAQTIIADRVLSLSEVVAAAVGLALWSFAPPSKLPRWCIAILLDSFCRHARIRPYQIRSHHRAQGLRLRRLGLRAPRQRLEVSARGHRHGHRTRDHRRHPDLPARKIARNYRPLARLADDALPDPRLARHPRLA
jgi:hypothetical protein